MLETSCGAMDLDFSGAPTQPLTRETDFIPRAEVSILGVDIDAISTDSFGITAVLSLIFLCLRDQVLRFIVWIPADPMQEGKAISHRDTDLGPKLHSSSCLATNNGADMSLNQVDDAVGHASRLGVQQDRLLSMQLADHEKLPPPMNLESRKACARGDQGIYGIKVALQIVELAAYCCFDLPPAWPLLFGDIEESCTCFASVVSRPMFA